MGSVKVASFDFIDLVLERDELSWEHKRKTLHKRVLTLNQRYSFTVSKKLQTKYRKLLTKYRELLTKYRELL